MALVDIICSGFNLSALIPTSPGILGQSNHLSKLH